MNLAASIEGLTPSGKREGLMTTVKVSRDVTGENDKKASFKEKNLVVTIGN